jgi:hypothetical protein
MSEKYDWNEVFSQLLAVIGFNALDLSASQLLRPAVK